jgi:hypothetical protein
MGFAAGCVPDHLARFPPAWKLREEEIGRATRPNIPLSFS